MRRAIVMVAVASALATTAGAATRLGVFGELNLATQSVRPPAGFTVGTRTTGAAGIEFAVDLGGPLSLRLEPSYVQKGSRIDAGADLFAVPVSVERRLFYAELPVLLQASTRNGRVRPYAALGVSAGYLLKARVSAGEGEGAIDMDVKNNLKKADASALLGAGVEVIATRMRFFLEGRYALGLVNIDKPASEGASSKNRGIQVVAGLTWRLGR